MSEKKKTPKQELRAIKAAHAKTAKKIKVVSDRLMKLSDAHRNLNREQFELLGKAALILTPIRGGHILKHVYRAEYVKVSEVYCDCHFDIYVCGVRVKSDGSEIPGARNKRLDVEAWKIKG